MCLKWRYARTWTSTVYEGSARQRQIASRIAAAEIDREKRVGEPAEPFEKIGRMARPRPQPGIADLAAIAGVGLESTKLPVGNALAGDGERR